MALLTPNRARTSPVPTRTRRGWRITPWLFLVVPLVLLLTFTYLPVANMVWWSFTSWDGLKPEKIFVGWKNYHRIFTDPDILQVFLVSAYYLVGAAIQLVLALYFAVILSFRTRLKNLFKGIIFFPYLVNGVAIGIAFLFFFRPDGTLDALLALFGVTDPPTWLGDPSIANYSLAFTSVWRYMGLNFVLFLGAIQSIPEDVYEAADLDGATTWHKVRYIVIPGISQIIGLTAILAISGALSVFEIPFIMTGGANGTTTFVIRTIDLAFEYRKLGLGSAMGIVLLLLVILITIVQRKLVPTEKGDLA